MENKTISLLALTKNGALTGIELTKQLPHATLYIPGRIAGEVRNNNLQVKPFENWRAIVEELFLTSPYLVFICAAGIAVRSIAPLLKSKEQDPGVVVLDEDGQYAVSLLSGHVGGANQLANEVARALKGEAVITTATDRKGFSYPPDTLASQMDAILEPKGRVKKINALMAEGEKANLYSPFPLVDEIRKDYLWQGSPRGKEIKSPALVVTPYQWKVEGEELLIKPPCLVAGVGCRKGVSIQAVREGITVTMEKYGLDPRCLKSLATVDIKADEKALNKYSEELGIPLIICSREEIATLEGTYTESPRVKIILGVGGVCEPTAKLAAGGGLTLAPKQKHGPVTVSIALARSWWWDWGRETGNC